MKRVFEYSPLLDRVVERGGFMKPQTETQAPLVPEGLQPRDNEFCKFAGDLTWPVRDVSFYSNVVAPVREQQSLPLE